MMTKEEALQELKSKGFDVIDYLDTLIIHNLPETQANELSRNDIMDALNHQVFFVDVRQINEWTIVIVF